MCFFKIRMCAVASGDGDCLGLFVYDQGDHCRIAGGELMYVNVVYIFATQHIGGQPPGLTADVFQDDGIGDDPDAGAVGAVAEKDGDVQVGHGSKNNF